MTTSSGHIHRLSHGLVAALVLTLITALLSGTVASAGVIQPTTPTVAALSAPLTSSVADDDEDEFNRQLVEDIARGAADIEVRDAAQAALDTHDPAKIIEFLDFGEPAAKKLAADRKKASAAKNRELVQGWLETGGAHVRAGAKTALDSGDDVAIADFVAYGKEIAEKADAQAEVDSKAEQERITARVRDMVAHGGPQVQVEGEAILLSGDYLRISEFYKTGYTEANKRDHDLQDLIVKALDERNKSVAELVTLAKRATNAATARAEILHANIQSIKLLEDTTTAMRLGTTAAHKADQILQEDKPGRASGHRGRTEELNGLKADATRQAVKAAEAADLADFTTAQVQTAASKLIQTGMTNGVDWAKVTIAVGAAAEAASKAAETSQHAVEATVADSLALDANANAQEHADNARKWREEAERQAQTAANLAEAAKAQQQIAIQARDRAKVQQGVAEDAARKARAHAANARAARISAQSAAAGAVAKSNSAVAAHGDAARAGLAEKAAADGVSRTAAELRTATSVCFGKVSFADQVEAGLKKARDEATAAGKDADAATRDIADAAGRARADANASAVYAERARSAAAVARSEATKAAAQAQRARQAAVKADQEAVTARRAADEANRLAVGAAGAATQARSDADMTRYEAEAAVSESNQAVFQAQVADRAAYAASASSSLIIDPARVATIIAAPFAGINADARRVMEVAADALMIGAEQAKSAQDKATEAGEAAQHARVAADTAVAQVKPAYEAAARAADSASQAAQYAVGAHDAAAAAVQYAGGAHRAATNAAQSAASARSDSLLAGRAASMATGAAEIAGRAAAAAETINEWAKKTTASIHAFTEEVGNSLQQFQDIRARQAEAERLVRVEAEQRQRELTTEFINGVANVLACAISQTSPACQNVKRAAADALGKAAEGIKDYVKDAVNCLGGDANACRGWEQANQQIADFGKNLLEGLLTAGNGFAEGMVKLGSCATGALSDLNPPACNEIIAGFKDLLQNPYKIVHLEVWHENPGKALGLTLFDVLTMAATAPLGGSGGTFSKVLENMAGIVAKTTTRLTDGAGWIGQFTVKLAETVTGKLPGATADITGIAVRIEGNVAKLSGAVARIDGALYRVEKLELKIDGDISRLEGSTVRIVDGKLTLNDGIAKLEGASAKIEPARPGDIPETAKPPEGNQPDGSWRGVEHDAELKLEAPVNARADALLKQAAINEKLISPKIERTVDGLPGASKQGWDHRLKGETSLKRKLAGEFEVDPANAFNKINDSVRYTLQFPEGTYTLSVERATARLKELGLEETVVKNFWERSKNNNRYRGINTTWRDPATGQVFEVQFHTEASLFAKTIEHPVYEWTRVPGTLDDNVTLANAISAEIFGNVPYPTGAINIKQFG